MMTNLFSMFDPSNFFFSLSWIIPNLMIFSPMILLASKFQKAFTSILSKIWKEMLVLTLSLKNAWFMLSIFSLLCFINLMSMVPSSFTITAHLVTVIPMGLSCWLGILIFNLINKTGSTLSHLTPSGSPIFLSPFLVLIELVSNMIRPITISVRLVANMTAGHLLMHLLSQFLCYLYPLTFFMLPLAMILTILELMVCVIQAYIFCALMSMYSSEIH